MRHKRRICFVTGSRAEFGLMRTVLQAIRNHPLLQLQIVVTGMHVDAQHGKSAKRIAAEGWPINAIIKWRAPNRAEATGRAMTDLARQFRRLKSDVVLVVGDRVEAFAAASAAHLCDIAVAHVHGGDRAMGQMDDTLRHAISKLAHIHFPATKQSAGRLIKMGEQAWRIHRVGSPGIDGIHRAAASSAEIRAEFPSLARRRFALVVLHPIDADESLEFSRADILSKALKALNIPAVIVYPNNDPGFAGIIRRWKMLEGERQFVVRRDLPRNLFLGLLRDAAMLVGNSSSGIIEAASLRTPVIDIGPRQLGRERRQDVRNVPYRQTAITAAASGILNGGHPRRGRRPNPYAGSRAGGKMASILARLPIDQRLLRKIISY